LFKVIEDLQSDKSLNSLSEADISLGVVLRILDVLSWSTYDRREVSPEYSVENRWVDYALLIGNTPQVFIEVKKGGESLERHQEQLLDYTFRHGVKIAALTNGATWWFYLPLREGSWKQRKFDTVEFHKQDTGEIAQKLADFLGRENVSSGKAVQNAEALYKKHRISATLPEAWNQLVSEPDDLLIELLAEKTGKLCGHEPDENEVEQFLSAHLQNIKITSLLAPVESSPIPEPKPPDHKKGTKRKAFTVTKPTAFTFNGARHEVPSWKEMILKLCKILYADHADFEQRVLEMRGRKGRRFFSRNADDLNQGWEINGTGIYVDTCLSAKSAKRFAENLITKFGYGKGSLSFEERQ
jgi:hypothetical protein